MRYERVLLCLNVLIVVAFAVGILATVAVGLTAIQSIPTIRLGQADSVYGGGGVQLNLPIFISNPGPLPISDLGGNANLSMGGTRLMGVRALTLNLPPGSTGTLLVMANLNLTEIDPALLASMLFYDANLSVDAVFGAAIAPLASLSLMADGTYRWGAPLGDLQVDQPRLLMGTEKADILIPVSFRNRSTMIPINGSADIHLLDQGGGEIGRFRIEVNAPMGSTFDGYLEGNFSIPANLSDLVFNDRVMNCTIVMNVSIPGLYGLNITKPYQLVWGAPIKDLGVNAMEVVQKNATHSYLVLNVSFVDGSSFIPLRGTLGGVVTDTGGQVACTFDDQPLSVAPGGTFSGQLAGLIDNSALGEWSELHLRFVTALGTFDWEGGLVA